MGGKSGGRTRSITDKMREKIWELYTREHIPKYMIALRFGVSQASVGKIIKSIEEKVGQGG